jgi:membrane associated rhomboid family serine protease/Zn-finger nucleic acid-binding protein
MFTCPHCVKALLAQRGAPGVFWICPVCRGRAAGFGVLRKIFGPVPVAAWWAEASGTSDSSGCACPVCHKSTARVTWAKNEPPLQLDLCRRCEFVWFDAGEYESLPPASLRPRALGDIDPLDLPPAAREILAMKKVRELAKGESDFGDEGPDETWKTVPALFGFPVEIDTLGELRMPIATYVLSALIAVVSLFAFLSHQNMAERFGLIPAEAMRDHGLTFATSFFLHAGLLHLVGNLYFLVIFGRHVEGYLGSLRWLLLVALAALAGDFLDIACTAQSTSPMIGASGGISGLLAFYTLKFPRAQLGLLFVYSYQMRWITIPAWSAFALWLLLQFWGAYDQLHQVGNVASLAHLGGVAAGVLAWWWWKDLDAKEAAKFKYPRIRIRS